MTELKWSARKKKTDNEQITEIKILFQQNDISFDSFTNKQIEMMMGFLTNHLIGCYNDDDVAWAKRIKWTIKELAFLLSNRINQDKGNYEM